MWYVRTYVCMCNDTEAEVIYVLKEGSIIREINNDRQWGVDGSLKIMDQQAVCTGELWPTEVQRYENHCSCRCLCIV